MSPCTAIQLPEPQPVKTVVYPIFGYVDWVADASTCGMSLPEGLGGRTRNCVVIFVACEGTSPRQTTAWSNEDRYEFQRSNLGQRGVCRRREHSQALHDEPQGNQAKRARDLSAQPRSMRCTIRSVAEESFSGSSGMASARWRNTCSISVILDAVKRLRHALGRERRLA